MEMSESSTKARGYCFTLNNYTQEHIEALECIVCRYIVYGKEIGACGRHHLQGFVYFKSQRYLKAVLKLLPNGCHVESMRGTIQQATEYCKKDGDFIERGEKPLSSKEKGMTEKSRWTTILKRAKEGDHTWFEQNEPNVWIHMSKKLKAFHEISGVVLEYLDTPHEWWYGPTGTGKSRKVWKDYPDHYQKSLNKWWDGYTGQDVVVIEEWSPKNECTGSQLKIWADRYPFSGEIKGGVLQKIRPIQIIVLSNYTIEECFLDSKDFLPLQRRFKLRAF